MVRPHDFVVSLFDVDRDDAPYVGAKNANLGEMLQNKFPVPPGFAVTAAAYYEFLKQNNLEPKIESLLSTINFSSDESLSQVSKSIKKLIQSARIPEEIVKAIFKEYASLGVHEYVAIRSSAIGEDSKEASFAGQNESYLDIRGEAAVVDKVREAWSSLFAPRSIFYRHERKVSQTKARISIVVQKMVKSDASGVIFTQDPITGDKNKVTVEAIFGLGEYIVQGKVTPDHFEVDKKSHQIVNKHLATQQVMLIKRGTEDHEEELSPKKGSEQKIKDFEVVALAKIAMDIEKHYYFPQDIEWAKEGKKLYIVQTRPITTTGHTGKTELVIKTKGEPVLIGDPASPGIATGHVKKIESPKEIEKVKKGDILVAPATNPDYVPAMKRAAAIITERGGRTSHAAIVSREFGIPAVVGASGALKRLKDNEPITVNGKTGEIFRGEFVAEERKVAVDKYANIKTATKLFVNMAEPELATRNASRNVDGVGLLRAEFMIAQIGEHPKKMIADGRSHEFISKLADGIATICKAFYPRPIYYRATDFKSNEYAGLKGGKEFEPTESNPMLGYRGAFRYIHDPKVFKLELAAIKKVREKMDLTNLQLMIPFVRTVKELELVKKMISEEGLRRSHTFKLRMMAEIPSNVILIEDFIKAGIDGISIGSNDLTMLILGTDRDNEEVAPEFDERNPAVLWALERLIKTSKKLGVEVSICGQAPSVYPSLVENLVSWGVSSISVSPDVIDDTRRIIYMAEERVLRKGNKS